MVWDTLLDIHKWNEIFISYNICQQKKEKKSILEGARPIDHNKMIQLSNDIKHNLSEIDRKY